MAKKVRVEDLPVRISHHLGDALDTAEKALKEPVKRLRKKYEAN